MKRMISVILSVILVLSCAVYAGAEDSAAEERAKISPELREALATAVPDPEPGEGLNIVVYFTDDYKTVADMPSWPTNNALDEYCQYVVDRHDELVYEVYKGHEERIAASRYIDRSVQGCVLIGDFCPDDIGILEESEHVRYVDVFDPLGSYEGPYGKYDYKLSAALNALEPDDYVCVWVGNSKHIKTVAEMPSWPATKGDRERDLYMMGKARDEYSAYINELETEFIEEAFGGVDDVYLLTTGIFGTSVGAAVKVSDLGEIASRGGVDHISYDACFIPQPETPAVPDMGEYKRALCDQYYITDVDNLLYRELLYHPYLGAYEPDSGLPDDRPYEYDWVLVQAHRTDLIYMTVLHSEIVGGRLLTASSYKWNPFTFGYGVYDAEQCRFFDINEINFDDYDGLWNAWQGLDNDDSTLLKVFRSSEPGDADGDGKCTILDATRIQRCLAGIKSMQELAYEGADMDRNGTVTVTDATAIQRCKAGLPVVINSGVNLSWDDID